MQSWVLKAMTQRLIGFLPNPHYWNELAQTHITDSIQLPPDQFEVKLGACRTHLEHLRAVRRATPRHFSALELGTGWFPVVPIGLFLCGASPVWTWDIVKHLRLDRVRFALNSFLRLDVARELERHLPDLLPDRVQKLREVAADRSTMAPAELLERLSIHYRIGDVMRSGLPCGSVDLFTSFGVLEYLPSEALVPLLRAFLHVAATDAVMSHYVIMEDQHAFFDRAITQFNFLKFSDRAWRWLNNPIIPLNRLRITDYRRALRNAGFRITDEAVELRGDPAVLAKVRLARRFRAYPEEDLLVLRAWLAATPVSKEKTMRSNIEPSSRS